MTTLDASLDDDPPAPPDQPAAEGFRVEGPGFALAWGEAADAAELRPGDAPRLREQTVYPVLLRATGEAPVALAHRDPVLLRGLRAADGGRLAWGTVDFGGQVGRSAFEVRVGGRAAGRFEVEVVPTKLDYPADYAALVEDTQEMVAALVLEWLRATSSSGGPVTAERPSRLEWALLLRHAMDELERALERIVREPRRALARDAGPARAERVRRPDAALHRAVRRGAGAGGAVPLGDSLAVRERLPGGAHGGTLDTPEHRWLAARLRAVRGALERLVADEGARPATPRRAAVLAELRALAERVARLQRREPVAAAAGAPPAAFASLQLLHAPGYREAYRACLLLTRGLRVRGGPAELALKDLHLLYEQWCWLALVRAVAAAAGRPLPAAGLLAADGEGLRVRLRRGWAHALRFPLPDGGRVVLVYEPRFSGGALLVPQRPDFLLEVHRPGAPVRRVVLDAKYRVDASPGYVARYGAPGPPEDALNSLHRYRDALRADQAIALFPGRDDGTFRESRLWRAIDEVGVGAIPLMAGDVEFLRKWMELLWNPLSR